MKEFITDIKCLIEEITDWLYKQRIDEGYSRLILLLDKMSEFIIYIEKENVDGRYDDAIISLKNNLNECLGAMESNDIVLLADILQYDLVEVLEGM